MALTQIPIELSSTPGIVDNSNATAITIDSSENVTFSGTATMGGLEIATSASDIGVDLKLDGNKTSNGAIGSIIFENNGDSVGMIRSNRASANDAADMLFYTQATGGNNTQRMAITKDGNLLVGTSVAHLTSSTFSGYTQFAGGHSIQKRSGGIVAYYDRLTDDGTIMQFRKDGSTVGSIGTAGGVMYIGSNDTGLYFNSATDQIYPLNPSNQSNLDDVLDLGRITARWDDIYATNGTIQTSDRNEKQDIAELSDAEQRVAVAAKGLLRKFRWISSVEENGDDARIHFGIIAQDLQAAFTAEGLDAGRYAMFISSTWTDEETGEERTRLGVRYSELLAFIISAI